MVSGRHVLGVLADTISGSAKSNDVGMRNLIRNRRNQMTRQYAISFVTSEAHRKRLSRRVSLPQARNITTSDYEMEFAIPEI